MGKGAGSDGGGGGGVCLYVPCWVTVTVGGGLRLVVEVSLLAVRQIVHPSLVTEPSLRQVNTSAASTGTLIGPVVPLYRWPPIVMKSHLKRNNNMTPPRLDTTTAESAPISAEHRAVPHVPPVTAQYRRGLVVTSERGQGDRE